MLPTPGLSGGILRGAAGEGIFHRDQRHGGVLHEPGLDAARRHQMLDFCAACDGGTRQRERQREATAQRDRRGAAGQSMAVTNASPRAWRAVSLIR